MKCGECNQPFLFVFIINKEEAEVVKRIFREYLEGYSYNIISEGLEADGFKTAAGGER
jgi:hypothetical protein